MADMKKEKEDLPGFDFDMPITRAANKAAGQVLADEKRREALRQKRYNSCGEALGHLTGYFFTGWMLMFAVALVGFPLGYWPCVLIAFTISLLVGTGTHNGIKTALKDKLK